MPKGQMMQQQSTAIQANKTLEGQGSSIQKKPSNLFDLDFLDDGTFQH